MTASRLLIAATLALAITAGVSTPRQVSAGVPVSVIADLQGALEFAQELLQWAEQNAGDAARLAELVRMVAELQALLATARQTHAAISGGRSWYTLFGGRQHRIDRRRAPETYDELLESTTGLYRIMRQVVNRYGRNSSTAGRLLAGFGAILNNIYKYRHYATQDGYTWDLPGAEDVYSVDWEDTYTGRFYDRTIKEAVGGGGMASAHYDGASLDIDNAEALLAEYANAQDLQDTASLNGRMLGELAIGAAHQKQLMALQARMLTHQAIKRGMAEAAAARHFNW